MTRRRGVLLVPQKDLDHAKSRMLVTAPRRREFAVAMLRRTLEAATGAAFDEVVAVFDNPADAFEVADLDVVPFFPGVSGLNESLVVAERVVRTRWGAVPLTVMPADLPLATPELILEARALAAGHQRAFLPDISSRGTTLLFAAERAALRPAYGLQSASAHERDGAVRLDSSGALDLLRHDVDNMADLFVANFRFEEGRKRWEETA
jgi:2-phospho-L-lactate guanylyltransferase